MYSKKLIITHVELHTAWWVSYYTLWLCDFSLYVTGSCIGIIVPLYTALQRPSFFFVSNKALAVTQIHMYSLCPLTIVSAKPLTISQKITTHHQNMSDFLQLYFLFVFLCNGHFVYVHYNHIWVSLVQRFICFSWYIPVTSSHVHNSVEILEQKLLSNSMENSIKRSISQPYNLFFF